MELFEVDDWWFRWI